MKRTSQLLNSAIKIHAGTPCSRACLSLEGSRSMFDICDISAMHMIFMSPIEYLRIRPTLMSAIDD